MTERPPSAQSRTAWSASPSIDNPAYSHELKPAYKSTGPGSDRTTGDPDSRITPAQDAPKENSSEPALGCWGRFKHGIRSIWATRETEDTSNNREKLIQTTLRELIIYMVFLIVLCIVTFGMTDSNMYYFTKALSELFLDSTFEPTKNTFRGLGSRQDFFRFAEEPLMGGLYWETWYTDRPLSPDELGYIYYENKLLGVPRIRSMRVKNDSCTVNDHFRTLIPHCYAAFSDDIQSTDSFGPATPTAWQYQNERELDSSGHQGMLAYYDGGGYIQDLNTTKAPSLTKVVALKDQIWLDRASRAVFVDFTVYNANINLFCVVRLITEFPPTGGALPSWSFRTVKLLRYVDSMDYFVMACEVMLALFTLYYTIEEILEIKQIGWRYFLVFWNVLDVLVIIVTTVVLSFNIYRTLEVAKKLDALLAEPESFADFDSLSYWATVFNCAIAVDVFMAWIKIFKYISFNKTMTQLSSTLGRCAKDLLAFAIMFFIVFFAFAQLGYLLFGSALQDFNTFGDCIFTLFRIILGDFNFAEMKSAQRVLGPIYFLLYVFFVFFILLNMFLAIINDTYSEVKEELAQQKSEFEMADYFKQGYDKMMTRMHLKRDKIVDIQSALKVADINQDAQLDYEEWRHELKARGYAEAEIEATFAKYDVDGDRVLDADEQARMHADLEGQKNKITDDMAKYQDGDARPASAASFGLPEDREPSEGTPKPRGPIGPDELVSFEEFDALTSRVDKMEESLGCIVAKIDAVLKGLEGMEKDKLRKRQGMPEGFSRSLDGGSLSPVSESGSPISTGSKDKKKKKKDRRSPSPPTDFDY